MVATRISTRLTGLFAALVLLIACGGGGGDGGRTLGQQNPQQPAAPGGGTPPPAQPPAPTPTGPPSAPLLYVLVSPDGSSGTEQVAAFGFDQAGSPAGLAGSPFVTNGEGNRNSKASGIVATADRRYLILSHNTSKKLESFSTGTQGALNPIAVVTLTEDPASLALHPNGLTVYASLGRSGKVAVVTIDPLTGLLTELPGSPFDVGTDVRDIAVDPTGRFLATGHMFGADRGVRLHALDTQGAIQSPAVQSIALTGRAGGSVAYDRSGGFLFVRDLDQGLYVYQVDPGLRTLSQTAASPISVGGFSTSLVIHPQASFVYVGRGNGTAEIHAFSYDNVGQLIAVPGSPFATPTGNYQHMTITRAGDRIYLTERNAHTVLGFNISAATGMLGQIGQPLPVPGTTSGTTPKRAPGALYVLD